MYEYVNGDTLIPPRPGIVAVPSQRIQERLRMPARMRTNTLEKGRREEYHEKFYELALRYLKEYLTKGKISEGILFAGPVGSGTSTIAAALLNEIVLRSEGRRDVTGSWLSGFYVLRMMLDAKDMGHKEQYQTLKARMMSDEILVVDDLLSGARTIEGKFLLETIYAHRADHGLPTITTVTLPDAGSEVTRLVERGFGKVFTQRLLTQTTHYRVKA